jgi:hypothetical protein
LLLAAPAASPPANAGVPSVTFPKVSGQNLSGKAFNLPTDFAAPASFVYVAFARGQQGDVDSWRAFVGETRKRFPAVGEYELPVISRGNAFFRGFIDGGMRAGIHDPAVRDATITLYIDKRAFDAALGIASEAEITVLLVKPDGTVVWRAGGSYDPSKSAGLDAALEALPK